MIWPVSVLAVVGLYLARGYDVANLTRHQISGFSCHLVVTHLKAADMRQTFPDTIGSQRDSEKKSGFHNSHTLIKMSSKEVKKEEEERFFNNF